jgi:hypothetical protein
MRIILSLSSMLCIAYAGSAAAQAPGAVVSVTAGFADSAGKVPAFNAVPGSAVPTWSIADPLGVLTAGYFYTYCVNLAVFNFTGNAQVEYKLVQGSTVIYSSVLVKASKLKVAPGQIFAYCITPPALPSSPGPATLTGTAIFEATGAKSVTTKLSVPVLLQ